MKMMPNLEKTENTLESIQKFKNFINTYKVECGLIFSLLVLSIIWTASSQYFLTSRNLFNILRQCSITGIVAIGMTFVILTGGIDLSVGSVLGFSSMVAAKYMVNFGGIAFGGILIALLVGLGLGLFNGIFVARVGLAPFIVTLAMMEIARSGTYIVCNGVSIYGFPEVYQFLGSSILRGYIPLMGIIMILLYIFSYFILNRTKLGRFIYALGGNKEAARLSGIKVKFYELIPYIISGLTAAIAGILLSARLNTVDPDAGTGLELDAIAAVVIGGNSLFGGKGSIIGTLIGVFIIGVLKNGLNLLGVSPFWQGMGIGGIILGALVLERFTSKS